MKSDGELEYCFKRHDSKAEEWKETGFGSRFKGSFDRFHLIDPFREVQRRREMTTQPKHGEWIKCSERLPEESGCYLVIRFENDRGGTCDYSTEHKGWNLGLYGERENELFPAYWTPLPEAPNE